MKLSSQQSAPKFLPQQTLGISRAEFSEIIVEEHESLMTISLNDNPSEYLNPEYSMVEDSDNKLNLENNYQHEYQRDRGRYDYKKHALKEQSLNIVIDSIRPTEV